MNTTENKRCAYCGSGGPFTNEHVFPNFLYKKYPQHNEGFNRKAGKYLESIPMVKDVCKECNNRSLSKLDAYAKIFYETNKCDGGFTTGSQIHVQYDPDMLFRFILKVTYNGLRGSPYPVQSVLKDAVPYILNGSDRPKRLYIFLEILTDYKIQETDRKHLLDEVKGNDTIPSSWWRLGNLLQFDSRFLERFLELDAFFFSVFLYHDWYT